MRIVMLSFYAAKTKRTDLFRLVRDQFELILPFALHAHNATGFPIVYVMVRHKQYTRWWVMRLVYGYNYPHALIEIPLAFPKRADLQFTHVPSAKVSTIEQTGLWVSCTACPVQRFVQ